MHLSKGTYALWLWRHGIFVCLYGYNKIYQIKVALVLFSLKEIRVKKNENLNLSSDVNGHYMDPPPLSTNSLCFLPPFINQEWPDFGMPILLTINIEQKNIIWSNTNYQLLENLTEIVDLSNVLTFAEG